MLQIFLLFLLSNERESFGASCRFDTLLATFSLCRNVSRISYALIRRNCSIRWPTSCPSRFLTNNPTTPSKGFSIFQRFEIFEPESRAKRMENWRFGFSRVRMRNKRREEKGRRLKKLCSWYNVVVRVRLKVERSRRWNEFRFVSTPLVGL